MFERYSERARRVIFFARYEASQFGSTSIETEHVLLGLLREDAQVINRFVPASVDTIRKEIESRIDTRERVSTSIDMPLSVECKRILGYAAEEADCLKHSHIGTEHLLLGMLRVDGCVAQVILSKHGLLPGPFREAVARTTAGERATAPYEPLIFKNAMLCHFLATLAYRLQKALRGAPEGFANYNAAPQVRTPHQLIRHIANILGYARTFLGGAAAPPFSLTEFDDDVKVLHEILEDLKKRLQGPSAILANVTPEQMLQGPFSDAMTHVGQLAMLRRLAGSPIAPENFIEAAIDPNNVSLDQPDPVSPDEDWPEAPDNRS